ncbi:sel1 repeat family protein [Luteolibacter pohnpeiensis]|uniref:Sel1 repeat family protein n=1 Tax=Luteolibacter pohnpeiensis TaxID=454153 RepID=A0A934S3B4_9BACT|nr:tetratricopeptide repeat protein [Luteolibacter pohnpeiensis]MBK1881128.1 sel1 repeat family protein [Luteolibacter pohnpeiensis]
MRFKFPLLFLLGAISLGSVHAAEPGTDPAPPAIPTEVDGPVKAAVDAFQAGDFDKAMELAKPLVEKGNADALYLMGFAYETGKGVELSQEQALDYYLKAAAKGQNDAAYRIAFIYLASEDPKVREDAKKRLETKAETDPQVAGRILGEAYLRGRFSKEPDYDQAVQWWGKSADAGDVTAMVLLGRLYEGQFGFADKIDIKKAMAAFKRAADQGDAGAMVTLASRLLSGPEEIRDLKLGREWLDKAIALKNPSAYLVLGDFEEKVNHDDKAALAAFERGKDAGQPDCAMRAADFYLEGKTVDKDQGRAVDLLETAAKAGNPEAHFKLAVIRLSGDKPDLMAGYNNLLNASVGGLAEAQNELGLFYLSGKLAVADPAAAAAWLGKAAQAGYPQAQNNLGAMYERGVGVPQNLGNAGKLYSMAADQGNGPATFAVARMLSQGLGTKVDLPKSWAYATLASERGETSGKELADKLFGGFDDAQKKQAQVELGAIKSGKAKASSEGK